MLVGGGKGGEGGVSALTYTLAPAGPQDTSRPLLSILGELAVFQELGVSTQCQNLGGGGRDYMTQRRQCG